jgi:hypothetical protein
MATISRWDLVVHVIYADEGQYVGHRKSITAKMHTDQYLVLYLPKHANLTDAAVSFIMLRRKCK